MADPDPLLDPPSWLPSWLSIDDIRTVRAAAVIVAVASFLGVGACVVKSADSPPDPVLVTEITVPVPTETSTPALASGDCPRSSGDAAGSAGSAAALIDSLGTTEVVIEFFDGGDVSFCVLVADAADERNRGLMGITDFAPIEGMVFLYEQPSEGPFYMFSTPTPLTISFWDENGAFVSATDMAPCLADDASECERYAAEAPFAVALELPQTVGASGLFAPGDVLRLVSVS